jgi:hypothetical protein
MFADVIEQASERENVVTSIQQSADGENLSGNVALIQKVRQHVTFGFDRWLFVYLVTWDHKRAVHKYTRSRYIIQKICD